MKLLNVGHIDIGILLILKDEEDGDHLQVTHRGLLNPGFGDDEGEGVDMTSARSDMGVIESLLSAALNSLSIVNLRFENLCDCLVHISIVVLLNQILKTAPQAEPVVVDVGEGSLPRRAEPHPRRVERVERPHETLN